MPRACHVCICASLSRTLYTGITGNLLRRIAQHRSGSSAFTARYGINRLVYAEEAPGMRSAIEREKQLKRWSREKKMWLIERDNPEWMDLARGWFEAGAG